MSILEAGAPPRAPKAPGPVARLDNELESSWREGRWGSFVRAWIATIILTTVVGFVVTLVMIGVYDLILSVIFHGGKGWREVLITSLGISAMAGGTAVLFTLPVMLVKGARA